MEVYVDFLPNQPKNVQTRQKLGRWIRQGFEKRLPEAVERMWDLPPMMVKRDGEYLALLLEARQLYLEGYFYPCVAMCGIVGERLAKDALRASVLVQKGRLPKRPSDAAFDQFERVEINGIVRFLREAEVLTTEAAKAAEDLIQLRNQYAHARGKASQAEAIKGIKLLHTLVEDTVSVFKDFKIKRGKLLPKESG
jgi:hypothetical protein